MDEEKKIQNMYDITLGLSLCAARQTFVTSTKNATDTRALVDIQIVSEGESKEG